MPVPTVEDLRRAVEEDRDDLVAYCTDLVGAPSVNPPGDTRAVAGVVASWLAGRDIESRSEACEPAMPSVLSELDSGRPGPHLVLNVHLDTMPPGVLSEWTVPVHELTRRDGRLYGLGMGNMKGAVAAMSWTLATLRDTADAWSGRVTFTAVADEVVFGDNGAAFLLRRHPELLGDALLCGEGPGFRRVAVAEKGVLWLRIDVRAEGGHSSAVRPGRSAAAVIAECVGRLDALTGRAVAPPSDLAEVARDGDPGVLLSVNVGRVEAGTFVGQIATSATAEADLRLPPGLTADQAEDLVRDLLADLPGTTVSRTKGWDANGTAVGSPFVQHFAAAVRSLRGTEPEYAVRLPASDASRWRSRGVPAICYGPQPTLSAGVDDHAEEQEVLDSAVLYTATALAFLQNRS